MVPIVFIVLSTALGAPQHQKCEPIPSGGEAAGSTFVLAVGYAFGQTPDLKELPNIHLDVLGFVDQMAVSNPLAVFAHLDVASHQRVGYEDVNFGPPSFPAVIQSVQDLVGLLVDAPRPRRVYFLASGHGQRTAVGSLVRTRLFWRPTPGGGPGADGYVTGAMLSEHILSPLEAVSEEIHMVVDACQSFFITQLKTGPSSQFLKRTQKEFDGYERMRLEFIERHPKVGVVTATNGARDTQQHVKYGGMLSYAVRSAAIGQADSNTDSVITYRELENSIQQMIYQVDRASAPGVVFPDNDPCAAFIDFRPHADIATIRIDHDDARRLDIRRNGYPFAVVNPPREGGSTNLYISEGTRLDIIDSAGSSYSTIATTGLLKELAQSHFDVTASKSQSLGWGFLRSPLIRDNPRVRTPHYEFQPLYGAIVGTFGIGRLSGVGPLAFQTQLGPEAELRIGRGRHQIMGRLGYAYGSGKVDDDDFGASATVASLGYLYLIAIGSLELGLGFSVGLGRMRQSFATDVERYNQITLGGIETRLVYPIVNIDAFGLLVNMRFGGRHLCIAGGCETGQLDVFGSMRVGFEWEFGL